jgi:hypothetical protein
METQTIIPVGNQVEGNITSCKIENQLIKIDKESIFSLSQLKTYAAYNVCDKEIINQYQVPEGTSLLWGGIIVCLFFIAAILHGVFNN